MIPWSVRFHQLPHEDIVGNVTYRAYDLLDPVLETVNAWKSTTELIKDKWADLDVGHDGTAVTIEGYPLHPYTQRRLTRYLLGVNASTKEVWTENPDLLSTALHKAPQLLNADQVQVRVVNGQVVYATDLPQRLGHHADYMELMAAEFRESVKRNNTPMALVGYTIDPVWVHVKLIYVPRSQRSFHVGVQFDTNYMFSKATRGRASYGLCAYDLVQESTLTLDEWWSARTPKLMSTTQDELFARFTERLAKVAPHLRKQAALKTTSLTAKNRGKVTRPWRQEVIGRVGRLYVGRAALLRAMTKFDNSGLTGATDFTFAMAAVLRSTTFERQVMGERLLAYMLKEYRK